MRNRKKPRTLRMFIALLLCGALIYIGYNTLLKTTPDEVEETVPPDSTTTEETTPSPTPESEVTISVMAPLSVDAFVSQWHFASLHGVDTMQNEASQFNINVEAGQTQVDEIAIYHESLPMVQGVTYHLSFDVTSSIDRTIEVFYRNNDTGEYLLKETIEVSPTAKHVTYDIPANLATTFNASLGFHVGGTFETSHDIQIASLKLSESSDIQDSLNIKVNHLGYEPTAQKRAIFPYEQGDTFYVIDTQTNQVVYTGAIVGERGNGSTGETNFYGDFTDLTTPGTYRVVSQLFGESHEFEIKEGVYQEVLDASIKMLYLQRSGETLLEEHAGIYAHDASHTTTSLIFGNDVPVDTSGGWYDAGDYGRYTVTGVKAVMDVLIAYHNNPEVFSDTLNIPESNNGIADVLDEARFQLEWLLKMQNGHGGVYTQVNTPQFPGYIMPDEDLQNVYIMSESSTATGAFVAATALGSIIYEEIDPEFSQTLLNASVKSWNYLQSIGYIQYNPPEGYSAGHYRDTNDQDERFSAASFLYAATGESQYLDSAIALYNANIDHFDHLDWKNISLYGMYGLLEMSELPSNNQDFDFTLSQHFINIAEGIVNASMYDGYFVSLGGFYVWGSNSYITNNAIVLLLADQIQENINYTTIAGEHLNYILGKNALDICYVTGFGHNSPENIHHRISVAAGTAIPGALVGGPNFSRDDPTAQALIPEGTPHALSYVDHVESYSTNEVTIYWNSALTSLISFIHP